MCRLSSRLLAALLTFALGVAAAGLWPAARRPAPVGTKIEESHNAPAPAPQQRTYEDTMDEGGAGDDFNTLTTNIKSSDGMRFTEVSRFYRSPRLADKEFRRRIRSAVEVIRREPVVDEYGQKFGEQAVVSWGPDRGASLIVTIDTMFMSITSSSVENILEFEKDHSP